MIKLSPVFKTIFLTVLLSLSSVYAQNLYFGPESVVFDSASNRYLVANFVTWNLIPIPATR